jgi:hypothetical protein
MCEIKQIARVEFDSPLYIQVEINFDRKLFTCIKMFTLFGFETSNINFCKSACSIKVLSWISSLHRKNYTAYQTNSSAFKKLLHYFRTKTDIKVMISCWERVWNSRYNLDTLNILNTTRNDQWSTINENLCDFIVFRYNDIYVFESVLTCQARFNHNQNQKIFMC